MTTDPPVDVAESPPADAPPEPTASGPGGFRLEGAVHLTCHLAVWAAVLVPTVAELNRGWRPFGDDAAIASRSYQVFSSHAPLLGLASAVSYRTAHAVFDPGPLLFYLLAVPVRVDPARGLLWGAALFSGIALSAAVAAAWSVGRWLGAALVAFVVLDMVWLTPQVFENLAWNAYFPIPFLIASIAIACAVCVGALRWWPVLVVTASVAAESHLFFVVPAVGLVVASGLFGLWESRRRGRFGWLVTGVVLGALCWAAPIVQQFTGRYGNFTGLLNTGHGQATLGTSFALRDIGLAAALHPVWLTHLPTGFYPIAALETAYAAWYGELVLGLLALIGVVALATGRRVLGALAVLTLVSAVGLVVSLAVFPTKNIVSIGYLIDALWIVGILLWVLALWAVVLVIAVVAARVRAHTGRALAVRLAPLGGALCVAALVVVGVAGIRPLSTHPALVGWTTADVRLSSKVATDIEDEVPPGPVSIVVLAKSFFLGTWTTEAVAYRLTTDGWDVGTSGDPATYSGLTLPATSKAPDFVIRLQGTSLGSLQELR